MFYIIYLIINFAAFTQKTTLQVNGIEKALDSPHFHDKCDSEYVSKTLQQAKEVLRLAKAAKVEADQIKKDSSRELELARRERHDASLLKKNAAEILKIAKTKLSGKH